MTYIVYVVHHIFSTESNFTAKFTNRGMLAKSHQLATGKVVSHGSCFIKNKLNTHRKTTRGFK